MTSYSVKNVKTFIGNEGHGFNATLHRGKKKVAFVYDDASGGDVHFDWVPKYSKIPSSSFNFSKAEESVVSEIFSDEEEKLFSEHCKSLPLLELNLGGGETECVSQSPDVAVTKLVNHFLAVKDAKKFLKKVTVFCNFSTDIIGYKIDPCQLTDGLRREILAQYPSAEGAVILNDLPFEEVVEKFEAVA